MDAVAVDSVDGPEILLAASSSSTPNIGTSLNRVIILIFSPGTDPAWTFIQTIELDSPDGTFDLGTNDSLKLIAWDDGNVNDVIIGSPSNNQAALILNVDTAGSTVDLLPTPPDAEFFGRSVGFGDVDGDGLNEILVGDTRAEAVYVYDSALDLPSKLSAPSGGAHFGRSIFVGSNGLHVGADYASAGRQARDAGGVYRYSLPLSCGAGICNPTTEPTLLTRGIKNEELGRHISLADSLDLVATPGTSAQSIAIFPSGGSSTLDLTINPDFGLLDNLSTGDLDESGWDEIVSGTSNAGSDSGSCYNVGAAFLYVDNDSTPLVLRSNDVIDKNNLFFGRSTAIAGGYLFVGEMGRNINSWDPTNLTEDGQIYVFSLPNNQ